MNKEKTPYLIENKERDTFTFYVKGTKPYLDLEKRLDQLTNSWNELEECVESRLMSIPDDICTNEVEEARRTTKIAVYQVILGKMNEIKEGNNVSGRN